MLFRSNDAEFRGWAGECANAGLGPCTMAGVPCVNGVGVAICAFPQPGAKPEECRWSAALFANAGEPTPAPANPCTSGTPGDGSGGGGGGGAGGSTPGSGSGAGASAQAPGTVLTGGVKVVAKAPVLAGARARAKGKAVQATGTYPKGATKVVQSLTLVGNTGVAVGGKCRLKPADSTYSCSAKAAKGQWRVITQALRGPTVLAQATATVTVR